MLAMESVSGMVGHRGYSEVTSDARQALQTAQDVSSDDMRVVDVLEFDLPDYMQRWRAPDRPVSAPPVQKGVHEFEGVGSPMMAMPGRAEKIKELKR